MIKQNLTVIPSGLIQSGKVVITADTDSGLLDFSETIIAGIGWFTKTIQKMQELTIDPKLLLSSSIKPKLKFMTRGITLEVLDNGLISVEYVDAENYLKGTAAVDLTGHYFEIMDVHVQGKLDGYDVELILTAEKD